jgi:hypothetical protein
MKNQRKESSEFTRWRTMGQIDISPVVLRAVTAHFFLRTKKKSDSGNTQPNPSPVIDTSMSEQANVIGINFGTSYSSISYMSKVSLSFRVAYEILS